MHDDDLHIMIHIERPFPGDLQELLLRRCSDENSALRMTLPMTALQLQAVLMRHALSVKSTQIVHVSVAMNLNHCEMMVQNFALL